MAVYTYLCPQCSGKVVVNFGDRILSKRLLWSASHRCHQCHYEVEEDGSGKLPDSLRNLLLQQEGTWAIHCQTPIVSNTVALKVIRQAFNLTLSEIKCFLHYSSHILPIGTRSEATLVLLSLGDNGIDCEVEQFEPPNLGPQS